MRYGPRVVKKIITFFAFPNIMSFEEYCKIIEDFIQKDTRSKRKFGFLIHDMNGDGMIDPIDM